MNLDNIIREVSKYYNADNSVDLDRYTTVGYNYFDNEPTQTSIEKKTELRNITIDYYSELISYSDYEKEIERIEKIKIADDINDKIKTKIFNSNTLSLELSKHMDNDTIIYQIKTKLFNFFRKYIDSIKTITPCDIRNLHEIDYNIFEMLCSANFDYQFLSYHCLKTKKSNFLLDNEFLITRINQGLIFKIIDYELIYNELHISFILDFINSNNIKIGKAIPNQNYFTTRI